jgi:hypothetical protein
LKIKISSRKVAKPQRKQPAVLLGGFAPLREEILILVPTSAPDSALHLTSPGGSLEIERDILECQLFEDLVNRAAISTDIARAMSSRAISMRTTSPWKRTGNWRKPSALSSSSPVSTVLTFSMVTGVR